MVYKSAESKKEGWVIQPDYVPLFEDFNLSYPKKHIITAPEDIKKIKWLYKAPDKEEKKKFIEKMKKINMFSEENNVFVQAWSAFGVDAVIWLCGPENAVYLCIENPLLFGELIDIIHETDIERTKLALETPIDMIVQRGWYSSTSFWSPKIFREFFKPKISEIAELVHKNGKLFGYVITTGLKELGQELIEAGVDLIYYFDPILDRINFEQVRDLFKEKICIAGGINSPVTLKNIDKKTIEDSIDKIFKYFGNKGGFILSCVDALYPDTPFESVEIMIEIWKKFRG